MPNFRIREIIWDNVNLKLDLRISIDNEISIYFTNHFGGNIDKIIVNNSSIFRLINTDYDFTQLIRTVYINQATRYIALKNIDFIDELETNSITPFYSFIFKRKGFPLVPTFTIIDSNSEIIDEDEKYRYMYIDIDVELASMLNPASFKMINKGVILKIRKVK